MSDKLELLLNKMHLESTYYDYFKSGELTKIIGNHTKDNYVFLLKLMNYFLLMYILIL